MYLIRQESTQDCLFTCFKIVLANESHTKEYLYLPSMKESAYSFLDIKEIAAAYHYMVTGYQLRNKNDIFSFHDKYLIITINKDKMRHAVIIKKIGKHYSRIIDPALGEVTMKTKTLLEEWDSYLLSLSPICDPTISQSYKYLYSSNVSYIPALKLKGGMVDLFVLKFISSLLLVLALGFIESSHYLIPLSFLAGFAVFEVLYQCLLTKKMKKVDELFFSFLSRPLRNKEELKIYEDYKSQMVAKPITIIYAFLVSLFLLFLLVYNSLYNLIFIGAVILLLFIRKVVLSSHFSHEEKEIDREEDYLFSGDNDITTFKEKFKKLHTKVYHYTYSNSIFKYVETFIIILAIILSMYFQHILSLTYVLLYYASSYYLMENIDKVMSYKESLEEYKLTRSKYSTMMARMARDTN